MEVRGVANGITIYDDFAHHPTAIRTTIDGLRRQVGQQRILAVFEPRSNTMKLGAMKAQLPWSLEQADLSFCHAAAWAGIRAKRCAHGRQGARGATIAELVDQVSAAARPATTSSA
jgi:UDP-N-acetylmuramate: L-alanyl-gamma-D-glutamyl-meso-diaminopimelate ligase